MKKIILAVLVVLFSVQTVSAASSAGVGGRPANPDPDNPRTQSIFIYTMHRGETKKDQLYLNNGGDTTETIQLYAVDGVVSNTGAFTCEQEVESRDDIGKAITLSTNEVTLAAGEHMLIDFALVMPKNSDVGEHGGCIVIQKKNDVGQKVGSVQVKTRTAVRVAVIVPGNIYREVSVEDFKAFVDKDGVSYAFGLKNSGNVSADVETKVKLRDIFGNQVAQNAGQYAVIANTTFGVNYDSYFHPFFGGWYKAKAEIAYDKRAGTFGITANSQLMRAEGPEQIVFIWPSKEFMIAVGALIAAIIIFFIWKRQQNKEARSRAKRSLKR